MSPPEQTVDNRDAGDLRRHHGHYDITVMAESTCYGETAFSIDNHWVFSYKSSLY